MQYRRYGDKIAVRLDRGEEIICSLERLCADEKIGFAWVCAIGAVGSFTVGVFSPEKKTYSSNSFSGDYEIVSLGGNVTRKDGGPYIHLHASFFINPQHFSPIFLHEKKPNIQTCLYKNPTINIK